MDNLYINIRIVDWHIQVTKEWKVKIIKNTFHKYSKYADGYFRIYKFFAKK